MHTLDSTIVHHISMPCLISFQANLVSRVLGEEDPGNEVVAWHLIFEHNILKTILTVKSDVHSCATLQTAAATLVF